jgi:hypothetical protein
MSEIIISMDVSIPDEIYEMFLFELGRDGFVFTKFGEYTLVLSMPDIGPIRTPYDAKMSQDELDKRDAFYKSIKFVQSLKHRDGEADSSVVDGKNTTGLDAGRQGASVIPNIGESEEHAGSNPAHPMMQMCKCGHYIGVVGTKWQHWEKILTDSCGGNIPSKIEIRYRETCYNCDCIDPKPMD